MTPLCSVRGTKEGKEWSFWKVNIQSLPTLFSRSGTSAQTIAQPFPGQPDLGLMLRNKSALPFVLGSKKGKKIPFFPKPPWRRKERRADHREAQVHWCRIRFQTETLQTKGTEDSVLTGANSSPPGKGPKDFECWVPLLEKSNTKGAWINTAFWQ